MKTWSPVVLIALLGSFETHAEDEEMSVGSASSGDAAKAATPQADKRVGGMSTEVALMVSCGVLAVVVVVLGGIFIVLFRRKPKLRLTFAPLHRTLDDVANTMTLVKLKMKAAEIIGSMDAAEAIVATIADKAEEDRATESGELQLITTPIRYPTIKIRTSTQLVLEKDEPTDASGCGGLHMTRLRDYYGDTLLLCQAPLPEQLVDQWKALWQEKVGLVVWIGAFKENNETKMEPYIPTAERQILKIGNFVTQTIALVKRPLEYDQYLVRAHKTKLNNRRTHAREFIFVHAHFWPDHSSPLIPAKLAEFVERVQELHERMSEKGSPGVMIHCSAGAQRSPALMAAYIGRQIWQENNKVNLLGIMRYIRHQRYKAFGLGLPAVQVQLVYGVMQIVAMRSKFQVKGKKARVGRTVDPFDEQIRVLSVRSSSSSGSGSISS